MDAERKITKDGESPRSEREGRERAGDSLNAETDTTNPEAVKEASRLGSRDTYLVETDLEDRDQREDEDQPDGRPGPLSNADNPER